MAIRPWVLPSHVRVYSDDPYIAERSDAKLKVDISRAETIVINYCKHDFSDPDKYKQIPQDVINATLILAEAIAHNSYLSTSSNKDIKTSETFDDYSYTCKEPQTVSIESLYLADLLEKYRDKGVSNNIVLRMRKL